MHGPHIRTLPMELMGGWDQGQGLHDFMHGSDGSRMTHSSNAITGLLNATIISTTARTTA